MTTKFTATASDRGRPASGSASAEHSELDDGWPPGHSAQPRELAPGSSGKAVAELFARCIAEFRARRAAPAFDFEAELLVWGRRFDSAMDQGMSNADTQRMLDLWFALQTALRQLQG